MAVRLAVACGVFGGVFLCCFLSPETSWMRSEIELIQSFETFSYLLSILNDVKSKLPR